MVRTSIDLVKLARKLRELGYEEITPRDLAELFGTARIWPGRYSGRWRKWGWSRG